MLSFRLLWQGDLWLKHFSAQDTLRKLLTLVCGMCGPLLLQRALRSIFHIKMTELILL